jgi:hypothetical protein
VRKENIQGGEDDGKGGDVGGQRTTDDRLRTTDYGQQTSLCDGQQTTDNGREVPIPCSAISLFFFRFVLRVSTFAPVNAQRQVRLKKCFQVKAQPLKRALEF